MRILIVDDEPDIQTLLTFFLEAMGHSQVVTAGSGFEALKILETTSVPFDLFMLDIQMPNMSGIELCRILRATPEYRYTPILMVTAMSDKEYVDTAFAAGATDYLNKPFDELELRHRIGLAERATFHERQVNEDAKDISRILAHEPSANPYDLTSQVPIDDVNGVMRVHAFESYLRRLSVMEFQKTKLFVLNVENIRDIHQRCQGREFSDQVADVAEAISTAFSSSAPFITYFGSGIYGVAMEGGHVGWAADMISEIEKAIVNLRIAYGNGELVRIELGLREVAMPSLFSGIKSSDFITDFIQHMRSEKITSIAMG